MTSSLRSDLDRWARPWKVKCGVYNNQNKTVCVQSNLSVSKCGRNCYHKLFVWCFICVLLCTMHTFLLIALLIIWLLPCDWTAIARWFDICQKISSQIISICCFITVFYLVSSNINRGKWLLYPFQSGVWLKCLPSDENFKFRIGWLYFTHIVKSDCISICFILFFLFREQSKYLFREQSK